MQEKYKIEGYKTVKVIPIDQAIREATNFVVKACLIEAKSKGQDTVEVKVKD